MFIRILLLIAGWAIGTLLYIPLYLIGMVLVPVQAYRKQYKLDTERNSYWWTDSWMRLWQTFDNGCVPNWYLAKNAGRSREMNIIFWSAFRNAVGGHPFHKYDVNEDEIKYWGTSKNPDADSKKHLKETGEGKWYWRVIRRGWRVGFWASCALSEKKVFDIQHGFKRVVYKNRPSLIFSPWDSGLRSH